MYIEIKKEKNIYILFIQVFISKNDDKIGKYDMNVQIENELINF